MKSAIAFLCKYPEKSTINFAELIWKHSDFDVFIIDDSCEYNPNFTAVDVIQIKDSVCLNQGYHNSNISKDATHIRKNPIAMDKALYFFCELSAEYDFVWIIEDDVFIPSIEALNNLDRKYRGNGQKPKFDLVTPNNFAKIDNIPDWHWPHVFKEFSPPYYYSMVCAFGMSQNMLTLVRRRVAEKKSLFYIEAMFNSMAMAAGLKVKDAKELKSICWQAPWTVDHFIKKPLNLWHPAKYLHDHDKYREEMAASITSGYKPTIKLPHFLK